MGLQRDQPRFENRFADRTALVIGAGWGAGAACAFLYASNGAKVVVSGSNAEDAGNIVARIKEKKGIATYIGADLSSPKGCELLMERTMDTYGSIDIACNDFAVFKEERRPAYRDIEGLDKELDIDLEGLYYCMKAEAKIMQKQGAGIIVNMSCLPGVLGLATWDPIFKAKNALASPERYNAAAYRARGVRLNTIPPALMMAALLEKTNIADEEQSAILPHPGRLTRIEQIVHLVLWLS